MKTSRMSYIKYVGSLLLFGTNGIVASHIDLESYYIVLLRAFWGGAFLLTLYIIGKQKFTFMNKGSAASYKKDYLCLLISGVTMGASWMFLYEAYDRIGVGIASLLYYCGPVIVMALSPAFFKEKITFSKLIGFTAVLCGIFLVNGQSSEKINVWGIVCGCVSALTYSIMVISNKMSKGITGMENTILQLFFGFLTVSVFIMLKNGFTIISFKPSGIVWILILGILNTGGGCYLYFSSIGKLPVQSVAVLGYSEPLSAVILSVIILGETMQPLQIVGAVLIIGGAIFSECFKIRTEKDNKNT